VTSNDMDSIILRARSQMRAALLLQGLLLAAIFSAGFLSASGLKISKVDAGTAVLVAALGLWLLAVAVSMKQNRFVQYATSLISNGMMAEAMPYLHEALTRFSIFRSAKLLAYQHLAAISHWRGDYRSAAKLCREVLRYRIARRKGLANMACLILADACMEMNDLDGAAEALSNLNQDSLRLTEQVQLLPVLLRWQVATARFEDAVADLPVKVRLAELLDAERASLSCLLMSYAARKCGMDDAWPFLLRRAAVYHDLEELSVKNPQISGYLKELYR